MDIFNYISNIYLSYLLTNFCFKFYPDYVTIIGTWNFSGSILSKIKYLIEGSGLFSSQIAYLGSFIGDLLDSFVFSVLDC